MCSKISSSTRRASVLLGAAQAAAIVLCFGATAQAQLLSEGPLSPSSIISDAGPGQPWGNPGFANASDDTFATVAPAMAPTQFLKATGFGFDIPTPAEIAGIEVFVERRSAAGTVFDAAARIVKGGVIGATDHAIAGVWPNTDTIVTYGSNSELWGETWTAADINSAGFGFALSVDDNVDTAAVDHISITVHYTLCSEVPAGLCRTAAKSIFIVKDKGPDNAKDKMLWKWIKGASTSVSEFADPTDVTPPGSATYALCVYEGVGEALIAQAIVPPNTVTWQPIGLKGFKYKDPGGLADGINKIILKGSNDNKSKAIVKGKGAGLQDVVPPLALPIKVILVNSESGVCWTSSFTTFVNNVAGKFKAKDQ